MRTLIVPILTLTLLFPALTAHAAQPVGELARLSGHAEVEAPRQHPLAAGDQVLDGETVTTGPEARLLFHMADETSLTLGGDTRFRFETGILENETATLKLLKGAFRLSTSTKDLTVETPMATIGIRGTDFWGGFFGEDEFGVLLFSGNGVEVSNDLGTVLLAPGEGTFLRPGEAPTPPATWKAPRVESAKKMVQFQ